MMMMNDSMLKKKAEIRKALAGWRDGLGREEREEKGMAVQESFMATEEFRKAGRICCYVSVGSEAGTRHLIEESVKQGKRVTVPLLEPKTGKLCMCALTDTSISIIKNPDFRITMDSSDAAAYGAEGLERARPGGSDIVIVPGIAFDLSGRRIGSGSGYYDRDILPYEGGALFVGFAFDGQVFPAIPSSSHDIPVHLIVTPTRKIRAV